MTRAQVAERRALARQLREAGHTWREIGDALGCSYQRAWQLGKPLASKPKPVVTWRGTIASWLEHRLRRVEECAASVGVGHG